MSWMRNAAGNPPSAAFPLSCGMGYESAFDCHDTADSRDSGMAKIMQKLCCQYRCHDRDSLILVATQYSRLVMDIEAAGNSTSHMAKTPQLSNANKRSHV